MQPNRTERVYLRIPVLVCGADFTRGSFSEVTSTVNVSRKGALILLRSIPARGAELRLTNLSTNAVASFVVSNQRPAREDRRTEFGIELCQAAEDFWGIEFEDRPQPHHSQVAALIVCRRCSRRNFGYLTETEYRALSEDLNIQRICTHCQSSTDWAVCSADEDPSDGRMAEARRQPTDRAQESSIELRGAVRYALRVPLHVTGKAGAAEETFTDDLSKTGLMFGCRQKLEVGEEIRAVVGYGVAEAPAVMTCKVVRRLPQSDSSHYHYGVMIESQQSTRRTSMQVGEQRRAAGR